MVGVVDLLTGLMRNSVCLRMGSGCLSHIDHYKLAEEVLLVYSVIQNGCVENVLVALRCEQHRALSDGGHDVTVINCRFGRWKMI